MNDKPVVLFACIHNSGRSVAAQVLARHYAGDDVDVRSAGSEPGEAVNSVVAQELAERGLAVAGHTPTKLDPDLVESADVVVTMGCGETCPVFPGKRYEDWPVDDPAGQELDVVRRIVGDIDARVRDLLASLGVRQFSTHVPVTYETCERVAGPFFHGTKSALTPGDELVPGRRSNFQEGRVSNNIYFSALVDTAAWGAELATALAGIGERGHIYVVEPLGPFEDDPNVTNKKFPGNPTRSYRTSHPLRVLREVDEWTGHDPEVLQGMLDRLAVLRAEGRDLIED